jgi:hypothetical protein
VVQSDLLQCLVENPEACEFAIRFSSGVICRHPDRRSFEKTEKPLMPPQSSVPAEAPPLSKRSGNSLNG